MTELMQDDITVQGRQRVFYWRDDLCIIELHDWLYPGEGTSGPFLRLCGQRDRDFIYRGENIFSVSNRRKW